MVTITIKCYHCSSENVVRDGRSAKGKQRCWCKDCERSSRDNPQAPGYTEAEKEQILAAYQERSSLCSLERVFGVARKTAGAWLKKSRRAPAAERNLGSAANRCGCDRRVGA